MGGRLRRRRNRRILYLSFKKHYLEDEKITIAGFALKNGYGHLDYYGQNNRVQSFKIYADENYIETIPIKDSISFEQYVFTQPIICETLRFVIDSVYPGTKYNDTCVAEVALLVRTMGSRKFYDDIMFLLYLPRDEIGIPYDNNPRQITSVSDADRLLLMDYLPYDFSWKYFDYKTKIALLDRPSSLQLNDSLPRLDGATAMYPLYSAFVRAVYPKAETIQDGAFEDMAKWPYLPNMNMIHEMYGHYWEGIEEYNSNVQCNTTSTAYKRLIDGEADIIFCYEPSEAEKSAAAEKGKSFSLTPIAKDAFVFITNEKNVLNNITRRQIRDIYSGRVTNWKTISGADEPVIAYQRPENSGSQTTLQSIMGGTRLIRPILDGEYIPQGMFGMIRKVASDYYNYNSAIGYSFLFYLTQMAGDSGTKVLSVDGVKPMKSTIQNGRYPFVQTVYAVTTGNESENTKKFLEWILSAQGQELVEKTGYTPVR